MEPSNRLAGLSVALGGASLVCAVAPLVRLPSVSILFALVPHSFRAVAGAFIVALPLFAISPSPAALSRPNLLVN